MYINEPFIKEDDILERALSLESYNAELLQASGDTSTPMGFLATALHPELLPDFESKIAKLEPPTPSGVASVDGLASNSTSILTSTKDINTQVPELYKRTIGETVDGVTDVTVKKPTKEELATLALTIAKQIKAVADASESVTTASSDIKSGSPLQVPKATKSLNYSKDVIALTGPELQMNLKVINNLIATLDSANNN